MELELGPIYIESAPKSIQELGAELIEQARKKFPDNERCGRCLFREQFHAPSNHDFAVVVDPFVLALEGFINQVVAQQSEKSEI